MHLHVALRLRHLALQAVGHVVEVRLARVQLGLQLRAVLLQLGTQVVGHLWQQ